VFSDPFEDVINSLQKKKRLGITVTVIVYIILEGIGNTKNHFIFRFEIIKLFSPSILYHTAAATWDRQVMATGR